MEKERTGARGKRRWLRRTIWAAAILVVIVVGGMAGLGWYFSSTVIVPNHGSAGGYGDRVLATHEKNGRRSVVLTASDGTRKPGMHGLSWSGGAAMIGRITDRAPGRVERELVSGPTPLVGTKVGVEWNYPADPRGLLDLKISDVDVATELGPAPAWYIPGDRTTWVIAVHGQNGKPSTMMPAVPTIHRLGLPVLDITYRNDDGAPASPDGLMHLGGSEWRDVEAAMRTAQRMGAKRFVLFGGSMGGTTVGQTLVRSPLARLVSAVVLDAPETSWKQVSDFQAAERGAPAPASWLVQRFIEWRTGVDLERMNLINHPPAHRPPMLLFHGTADEEVPVQSSRNLVAAAGRLHWEIRYEEFRGAGHTQSWNIDPARYEKAIADFLTTTVPRS